MASELLRMDLFFSGKHRFFQQEIPGSGHQFGNVSKPGALNCYTFFRPILLTLSVFRNLISTLLPLSECLDSLLCDLIAPIPGLAFSLVMSRTLAAALSFSSGRDYPSLSFLLLPFLRLTATLIRWKSTSLLLSLFS